jgi:tRNA (guanine10-N2)-dimethyltransferase
MSLGRASFFSIFTGENVPLARSELLGLLEGSGYVFEIMREESRFSIVEVDKFDEQLVRLLARLAYCRYVAIGLGIVPLDKVEDITRLWKLQEVLTSKETFAVRAYGFSGAITGQSVETRVGKTIQDKFTNLGVDLSDPQVKILVVRMGKELLIGNVIHDLTRSSWHLRRPRKRVFFHPSAMFPNMARLMVNLSRINKEEIFLDPLVGTGSLLIEASLMGMYSIGIDVVRWISRGARYNLLDLELADYDVLNADSRRTPIREVHGIATDFPYGRCTNTLKSDPKVLAMKVIDNAADLIRRGRFFVAMYPKHWGFTGGDFASFMEMDRHEIPVHRNLTRVISVMKRV